MIDLGGSLLRWRKIWTGDLDISGTGTASRTPTAGTDIANKTYVDNQTLGTINITVEEVDGAPSITDSPTLQFDQADGFVVTNPSGSIARVDLAAIPSTALATVAVAQGGTGLTASPITVPLGGTGVTTLATGYVKSNAAAAFTQQAVPIPVADGGTGLTASPITVPLGGTGVTTLAAGYVKSAGAAAFTSQAAPIPVADGGTGATTLTNTGVLVGAGTSAVSGLTALTKGQLLVGQTAANPVALAIGTDTHVLTLDSAQAAGVKWATTATSAYDKTAVAVSVTNTITETTVYSKSVTGNTLGATGKFRLTLLGLITDTSTNATAGVDTLTIRCKFGATTFTTADLGTTTSNGTTRTALGTAQPFKLVFELQNKNATNSQVGESLIQTVLASSSVTIPVVTSFQTSLTDGVAARQAQELMRGTGAIDTTVAQTLLVSVQWSVAQTVKTFTMDSVVVEQF